MILVSNLNDRGAAEKPDAPPRCHENSTAISALQ